MIDKPNLWGLEFTILKRQLMLKKKSNATKS